MYVLLRHGDRLPTVAVLQVLLNRGIAGRKLQVDGIFGGNTKSAVRDFQRPRGLRPDGVVGEKTWPRLIAATSFGIVDAVDITDPDVLQTEGSDIRLAGGRPVFTGSVCNGVAEAINGIRGRVRPGDDVVLVRFYGHGSPAAAGISDGVGSFRDAGGRRVYIDDASRAAITSGNVRSMHGELVKLRPIFGPYSSVEFHGCRVASGPDGRQLIDHLAGLWDVPVTGAVRRQFAGGTATFRFEGPTYTGFPRSVDLRSWSRSLPALAEMSVA